MWPQRECDNRPGRIAQAGAEGVAVQTLRRVRPHELCLGGSIPCDLLDFDGNIVIAAGTELTQAVVRRLPERFYAAAGSIDRLRVDKVVGDVFGRLGHGSPVRCQRREARKLWRTDIKVEIEPPDGAMAPRRHVEVQTMDISRNGCSFLFRQFVAVGSRVHMILEMLPAKPTLVGEVRNCRLLEGMMHRVGVEFIAAAPAGNSPIPKRKKR
jgi:hypothetical protein